VFRNLALFAFTTAAWGQVASGTFIGEVRDASSALVPGVKIGVLDEATGFSRIMLTGQQGMYRIDELRPGTYTITAEKAGFRTVEMRHVTLEINQKARVDFELAVSPAASSIVVTGQVSPLQSEDATVGYRLDKRIITSLPLEERNVIALVTLGPGAIPRQLGGFSHDVINDVQEGPRGAVALNPPINGSRSTMNAYLLDGAYNTDRNTYAIAVNPPMESVQEFRIQSSAAGAEFAQAAGGVIDVVTKTGSQAWHGGAFEFFRNEALDARNYFDSSSQPRPVFRQSQFGGSLSGPVPLPSTFFFVAYEGLLGKSASSTLSLVPDTALRNGNFSAAHPIFDPLTGDAAGVRQPFPGNAIPRERIDSAARKFIDTYEPQPNQAGRSGSNYLDATPSRTTGNNVSGRIDHQFRNSASLFGRYIMNDQHDRLASSFPVRPTSQRLRAQQAALAYTYARPLWLNEARLSFTRLRVFSVPESAFRTNVAQELGISGAPADPFTFGLPYFAVSGYSIVTDSPGLPQVQRDNSWNASEGLSLVRGRHTWKFGFQWVHFQVNYLKTQHVRGQYTFTGAFTGNPSVDAASGDALADFLLGYPQLTSRNAGSTYAYLRQDNYAAYVLHDWQVTGRLSLNLGLRHEYFSPFTETRGNLLNLDYTSLPAPPRLVRVASATNPEYNNFAPRAGLALRLPKRFGGKREAVFRAGYGVYFSPEITAEVSNLVSNNVRIEQNQTDGSHAPTLTLRAGFPQTAATGFPSYFGLDPSAAAPYVQQWTASLQRDLPSGILAEVAYIGSKGTRLGRFRRFNTPLHEVTGENLPPRPGDLQSLRPFPQLGSLFQTQHIANSTYHSLQIKAEKRLSQGLGFLASFVWAKSIDDADSILPGQFESFGAQDERNLRLERGLSFFNVGRRVSVGFTYSLPAAKATPAPLRHWELSGIVTLQDGTPLNPVYFAFDPANSGTPNRPDVVPGVSVALPRSQRSIERFFNTAAFQAPNPHTFGNAGRNILPGPGNNVFDLALHRRFVLSEARALEFRVEGFNTFNHPNWGIPGPYPDFGPHFGRIFATGEPRRIQLALRFEF
jgi:hypothetical protein